MCEPWYSTFGAVFWMTIGGLFFAFLGTILKSKCKHFECCGVIVDRDIRAETAIELANRTANAPPLTPQRNNTDELINQRFV